MHKVYLDEKDALDYVKESIEEAKIKLVDIKNARYHHNSDYQNAPSIVKHGLLPIESLHGLGVKTCSDKFLKCCDDTTSHINGCDGISLAVVGMTDLYKDEDEFDPLVPHNIDFIISSDVYAYRNTTNYGNEFICPNSITNDLIRAVDIRLLTLINEALDNKLTGNTEQVKLILEKYNALKKVCEQMKKSNLDAYLREMSLKQTTLDYEKVASNPILKLKK